MRKVTILALVVLLAGLTLAVVDQPEPDDGEVAITDIEQQFDHSFNVTEDQYNETETGLINYEVQNGTVTFEGVLQTPTPPPCNTLQEEVNETDDSYRFEIDVQASDDEGQICPQVITYQKYNATFDAEEPYSLEIVHEDEVVESIEVGETGEDLDETEDDRNSNRTVFDSIREWFSNLF